VPEALPNQHTIGSVVVEDIPVSKHIMSSDPSGGQVDTLCDNLEEVLPTSGDDQIVDYFENTEVDTEQSLLSTLGKKTSSPVLELDNEPASSHVDIDTVALETGSVEDNDQPQSVSSSDVVIDNVIKDMLGDKDVVVPEENIDSFSAEELTQVKEDTDEDHFEMGLHNEEEPTGIKAELLAAEKEKSKLELSDFIEEHYSKEVQNIME